ncbi:E3 ubiquitin-protein ligase RNF220 [Drosophila grimshawi]|uniref:GH18504 n=1 Tax=Drosophila grimshawi TaxID=7222 RepID=B4JIE7_DROGR|nr:E3 ubiquitin-protein ligase RNF220 [Drosophila grimshawi]EDV93028.1 GH18504 [Drosophila grimshawi]
MATETVPNTENYQIANGDEDVICPTCDAKIKRSQVADHCQMEMERLHSMQLRSSAATSPTTATASASSPAAAEGTQRRPWSIFQRVQRNRQSRQRQRTRKRPTPPPPAAPPPAPPVTMPPPAPPPATTATAATEANCSCPVCNKNFTQAEIHEHVNQCLRTSRNGGNERQSSEDDEDSDEYEEYEWAGQKRIRVSTLVQGGYGALNLGQTIKYNGGQQATEDEDDVNVDEDDTHIYGPTQYGEADVIPLASDDAEEGAIAEADVTSYVRRLISSNETTPKPSGSSGSSSTANHSSEQTTTEQLDETDAVSLEPSTSKQASKLAQTQQQIIESLKARLRLYEKQAQSKLKCLICIDDYKNPAISVSCWHVHCEQCWLQTLGARKLCPQCNSITTPKDLRRIYL